MTAAIMNTKVALIHDWLNGMRGGEKVLENILDLFPEADVFTLFYEPGRISEKIRSQRIVTSRLNRFGAFRRRYRYLLPLFPAVVEEFDLQAYDLVISSSHCVAKGVIPAPRATHVSYIHSPMRYAWDQYYAYFGSLGRLKRAFVRRQISRLRAWDVTSSARVDHFIANSNYVKSRIRKYYRRDAEVIHPPIDTEFFHPIENPKGDYFLTVSALVPYKMNHLLVEAFNRLDQRLVIVGRGTEEKRLRRLCRGNVEFRWDLSGEQLRELYQNARALLFAGVEDFGMSFVEAHACGVPIIAYGRGGVLDIIEDGVHGMLIPEQSVDAVVRTVEDFMKGQDSGEMRFVPADMRRNSLRFSGDHFKTRLARFLEDIT